MDQQQAASTINGVVETGQCPSLLWREEPYPPVACERSVGHDGEHRATGVRGYRWGDGDAMAIDPRAPSVRCLSTLEQEHPWPTLPCTLAAGHTSSHRSEGGQHWFDPRPGPEPLSQAGALRLIEVLRREAAELKVAHARYVQQQDERAMTLETELQQARATIAEMNDAQKRINDHADREGQKRQFAEGRISELLCLVHSGKNLPLCAVCWVENTDARLQELRRMLATKETELAAEQVRGGARDLTLAQARTRMGQLEGDLARIKHQKIELRQENAALDIRAHGWEQLASRFMGDYGAAWAEIKHLVGQAFQGHLETCERQGVEPGPAGFDPLWEYLKGMEKTISAQAQAMVDKDAERAQESTSDADHPVDESNRQGELYEGLKQVIGVVCAALEHAEINISSNGSVRWAIETLALACRLDDDATAAPQPAPHDWQAQVRLIHEEVPKAAYEAWGEHDRLMLLMGLVGQVGKLAALTNKAARPGGQPMGVLWRDVADVHVLLHLYAFASGIDEVSAIRRRVPELYEKFGVARPEVAS